MPVSADNLRSTLTAGASVRDAPVTKLIGPASEVYDLLAPQSSFLSVGSGSDCAIVLAYPTISARQCSLEFSNGQVVCTHWPKAKNRTFVDGVPIYAAELTFGCRLRLGDAEFIAFSDTDQLADARALQAYEDGHTFRAAADTLGIPVSTARRMVLRAQTLYDGVVANVIDDEQTRRSSPHRKKRRHRSHAERILGIPVDNKRRSDS